MRAIDPFETRFVCGRVISFPPPIPINLEEPSIMILYEIAEQLSSTWV